MSTVEVGAAPVLVVLLGPVVLTIGAAILAIAGAVVGGGVALAGAAVKGAVNIAESAAKERERQKEQRRREEEQRRQLIVSSLVASMDAERDKVKGFSDAAERKKLLDEMDREQASAIASVQRGGTVDEILRKVRARVQSAKMDDEICLSIAKDVCSMVDSIDKDAALAFKDDVAKIRAEMQRAASLPMGKRIREMRSLIERGKSFAEHLKFVNSIDTAGKTEKRAVFEQEEHKTDIDIRKDHPVALLGDILDFFSRIEYFDSDEAARLCPLIEEASAKSDIRRLSAIRDQVRTTYGKLKEIRSLSETYRQELRELLPFAKRCVGAESLFLRMEDLLKSREILRDEYTPVYEEFKILAAQQFESVSQKLLAEKVQESLGGLGYSILAQDDNPEPLVPGKVRYMDSPYDGYRVQVKVGTEGQLATRLVRVVGSEEEKKTASEYQRQKDIEVGKKWCGDLNKFHETLQKDGIELSTLLRKEPDEEELLVIVDSSLSSVKAQQSSDRSEAELQRMVR